MPSVLPGLMPRLVLSLCRQTIAWSFGVHAGTYLAASRRVSHGHDFPHAVVCDVSAALFSALPEEMA